MIDAIQHQHIVYGKFGVAGTKQVAMATFNQFLFGKALAVGQRGWGSYAHVFLPCSGTQRVQSGPLAEWWAGEGLWGRYFTVWWPRVHREGIGRLRQSADILPLLTVSHGLKPVAGWREKERDLPGISVGWRGKPPVATVP